MREASLLAGEFRSAKALSWSLVFGCELDLAVEAVAGVRRAISVAVPGGNGQELRVAFTAASSISIDAIRLHCRERLPTYMQPTLIRQVETLPQNANGKVDRRAAASLLADEAA